MEVLGLRCGHWRKAVGTLRRVIANDTLVGLSAAAKKPWSFQSIAAAMLWVTGNKGEAADIAAPAMSAPMERVDPHSVLLVGVYAAIAPSARPAVQ